jgi:hypothetical protein
MCKTNDRLEQMTDENRKRLKSLGKSSECSFRLIHVLVIASVRNEPPSLGLKRWLVVNR